jgi:hypothetical protein
LSRGISAGGGVAAGRAGKKPIRAIQRRIVKIREGRRRKQWRKTRGKSGTVLCEFVITRFSNIDSIYQKISITGRERWVPQEIST